MKTGQGIWEPAWMPQTEVSVGLTEELLRSLDERAARDGQSRSALIRDAVDAHLHDEEKVRITREIIEGYERIPPTSEGDPW